MSLDSRKLDKVFEEAELAFWNAVASALPEIKLATSHQWTQLGLKKP